MPMINHVKKKLALLVYADLAQGGHPRGRGQSGQPPASQEKIESSAVSMSNIYKTQMLNFRHHAC